MGIFLRDEETSARRGRRMRRALAVAALALLVVAIVGGLKSRDSVAGSLRWSLEGTSADGRTLTIVHDDPNCGTKYGEPVVREHTATVSITVPELRDRRFLAGADGDCTLDARNARSKVQLASPLGQRKLIQPR